MRRPGRPWKPTSKRRCNICQAIFVTQSRFERFCEVCKRESELYRFAEWLVEP